MSHSVSYEFEIEREDVEITLEVSGSWTPGDPGRTYGPIEDCYPPEPPEAEVEDAVITGILGEDGPVKEAYGWKVGEHANFQGSKKGPTLTPQEIDSFEERLIDKGGEDQEAEREAAAEAKYEMMREDEYFKGEE